MLPYLWPTNDPANRCRVIIAAIFLVLAKGATVLVPIVYGRAVDVLAPKGHPLPGGMLAIPAAALAFAT